MGNIITDIIQSGNVKKLKKYYKNNNTSPLKNLITFDDNIIKNDKVILPEIFYAAMFGSSEVFDYYLDYILDNKITNLKLDAEALVLRYMFTNKNISLDVFKKALSIFVKEIDYETSELEFKIFYLIEAHTTHRDETKANPSYVIDYINAYEELSSRFGGDIDAQIERAMLSCSKINIKCAADILLDRGLLTTYLLSDLLTKPYIKTTDIDYIISTSDLKNEDVAAAIKLQNNIDELYFAKKSLVYTDAEMETEFNLFLEKYIDNRIDKLYFKSVFFVNNITMFKDFEDYKDVIEHYTTLHSHEHFIEQCTIFNQNLAYKLPDVEILIKLKNIGYNFESNELDIHLNNRLKTLSSIKTLVGDDVQSFTFIKENTNIDLYDKEVIQSLFCRRAFDRKLVDFLIHYANNSKNDDYLNILVGARPLIYKIYKYAHNEYSFRPKDEQLDKIYDLMSKMTSRANIFEGEQTDFIKPLSNNKYNNLITHMFSRGRLPSFINISKMLNNRNMESKLNIRKIRLYTLISLLHTFNATYKAQTIYTDMSDASLYKRQVNYKNFIAEIKDFDTGLFDLFKLIIENKTNDVDLEKKYIDVLDDYEHYSNQHQHIMSRSTSISL